MNTPVGYFCRYSGNNRARNFNTAPRPGILLIQSNRQIGPAQNIGKFEANSKESNRKIFELGSKYVIIIFSTILT
jgi:hypothetical protein